MAYAAYRRGPGAGLGGYFEAAVRAGGKPKSVANWVLKERLRELPGDDERAREAWIHHGAGAPGWG